MLTKNVSLFQFFLYIFFIYSCTIFSFSLFLSLFLSIIFSIHLFLSFSFFLFQSSFSLSLSVSFSIPLFVFLILHFSIHSFSPVCLPFPALFCVYFSFRFSFSVRPFLSHTQPQSMLQGSQENDLRSVAEGWVVEARGRLYQCYHQSRSLSEQLMTIQQCLSLFSAQAGLVQLPSGQSSLISTAMDTLARMAGRVESLVALTDPSTPRGTNNLTSPSKEKERINMYHV